MEDFLLRFREMESEGIHPVDIAAYLHDELVRIHPFIDGNGRTSRLLMNLYLLRHGYVLLQSAGDIARRQESRSFPPTGGGGRTGGVATIH